MKSASTAPTLSAAASGESEVRARILASARAHFFRLGSARFTMDDLARELGMSKRTVYQHFRGKDQLLDALICQKTSEVLGGAAGILAAPGLSFHARAARLLSHVVGALAEISTVFLRDLQRFEPTIYARLEEIRARNIPSIWKNLLQGGIASGAVRPDIDVEFTARAIVQSMQHLLRPETLEEFGLQPHEMMRRFFQLLFSGLLTASGRADHENQPNPLL